MAKLFGDYQDQVLQMYREKAVANDLSPRLSRPTPAELKKECITVCSDRYSRSDDHTLRTFFDKSGDLKTCVEAIEVLDINRFKPLINFMRGETSEPKEKIVELLAWLLDFQPRPFEKWKRDGAVDPLVQTGPAKKTPEGQCNLPKEDPSKNGKMPPTIDLPENEGVLPKDPVVDDEVSGKPERKSRKKAIILAIVFAAISIGIITYLASGRKTSSIVLTGNEKCMYWAGDHYEPVSCSQKMGDILVVALDSGKVAHFRKITQPDTITYRSRGAVWYVKVRGNIEFYTSDGFHPTETQLRLRPITDYIINKYILANN